MLAHARHIYQYAYFPPPFLVSLIFHELRKVMHQSVQICIHILSLMSSNLRYHITATGHLQFGMVQ